LSNSCSAAARERDRIAHWAIALASGWRLRTTPGGTRGQRLPQKLARETTRQPEDAVPGWRQTSFPDKRDEDACARAPHHLMRKLPLEILGPTERACLRHLSIVDGGAHDEVRLPIAKRVVGGRLLAVVRLPLCV